MNPVAIPSSAALALPQPDVVVSPESHAMIGSTRIPARMLCSCGKVLLWERPEDWTGHLLDQIGDDALDAFEEGEEEDVPAIPEDEPQVGPTTRARAQGWRAEKGIPEMPRASLPSRQPDHRREEYDARNDQRRRERRMAKDREAALRAARAVAPAPGV